MRLILSFALLFSAAVASAQSGSATSSSDSLKSFRIPEVEVTGIRAPKRTLRDVEGMGIFSSKKTEVIQMQGSNGNFSLNNTRQSFVRAPGVFIWEQDGSGVQAGVAVRGLSPNRSWEFNTRKDGYDISADIFGYPEAYYTPPFESLERIELVRGSASLQFGPQFGGLLNYVTKSAPRDRSFSLESSQVVGSTGFYSTYTALGGTIGDFSYYTYFNLRTGTPWRENNRFTQGTFYARGNYRVSESGTLGFSMTYMNYLLQQPGGLTEAQYQADARQATRSRDWFSTPWAIPTLSYEHTFSEQTRLNVRAFALFAQRNSVGLTTTPNIVDSLINPRRVDQDIFTNFGTEARLLHQFDFLGNPSAIVTGIRYYRGNTERDRGRGSDGDSYDMTFRSERSLDLNFTVQNVAAFAELKLALSPIFSLTPGARLDYISTVGTGQFSRSTNSFFEPIGGFISVNKTTSEVVPLLGLGATLRPIDEAEIYANIAQAYRPALFSDQFQNSLVDVDENLRASSGWSSDIGVRGFVGNVFTYDIGAFFMIYGDRVGTLSRAQLGADSTRFPNGLRTNVGTSRHFGVEAFVELDVIAALGEPSLMQTVGSLDLFTAVSYVNATYISDRRASLSNPAGSVQGNRVEFAPEWIVRAGLTYRFRSTFSVTLQGSYVGKSFSDASNTIFQANGVQGVIPEYTIFDLSASWRLFSFATVEANINNLLDRRYFTRRAGGYPGPGIIPGEGRVATLGVRFIL
jgi:Fe(3+) dicitrate transport protein